VGRAHLAGTQGNAAAPSAPRRILHVDLHPFFVSVERAADPALRKVPVVVGGGDVDGVVAAASDEARAAGVRTGQSMAAALALCPTAVVRAGDLATYARVSDEVTAVLLKASRRVERPSADEAYVDLGRLGGASPVALAESIKAELQQRLDLDASLGLASSRIAARVASCWARPRGLLVVIPGYESRFLAGQELSFLTELPPHAAAALRKVGIETLGALREAEDAVVAGAVGQALAQRIRREARGEDEEPIEVAAPPVWVQEEAPVRDGRADAESLSGMLSALADRAARRIRCFGLAAGNVAVEVERVKGVASDRRDLTPETPLAHPEDVAAAVREAAEPLLTPAAGVKTLRVRLSKLRRPVEDAPLFA
jgi:DNA polymerase-4